MAKKPKTKTEKAKTEKAKPAKAAEAKQPEREIGSPPAIRPRLFSEPFAPRIERLRKRHGINFSGVDNIPEKLKRIAGKLHKEKGLLAIQNTDDQIAYLENLKGGGTDTDDEDTDDENPDE